MKILNQDEIQTVSGGKSLLPEVISISIIANYFGYNEYATIGCMTLAGMISYGFYGIIHPDNNEILISHGVDGAIAGSVLSALFSFIGYNQVSWKQRFLSYWGYK